MGWNKRGRTERNRKGSMLGGGARRWWRGVKNRGVAQWWCSQWRRMMSRELRREGKGNGHEGGQREDWRWLKYWWPDSREVEGEKQREDEEWWRGAVKKKREDEICCRWQLVVGHGWWRAGAVVA